MQLPPSEGLPVHLLAACFNKTTATYKYYWLLSLLQAVEDGQATPSKRELFARMLANAWYTVNYFHVSFGKQDQLQKAILEIKRLEHFTLDESRDAIIRQLLASRKRETTRQLDHFNRNVPHWFLSPWFPKLRGETEAAQAKRIYQLSKTFQDDCPYALHEDAIEIHPSWLHYLRNHARVLKDFCYWNLALFLQARNPNVPDIPNKLVKPAVRNSLTRQRKEFWDPVIAELGQVPCIYTGRPLSTGNYAVEHFIPYHFVSHDLIWNLIPADPSFNASKSDKLPPLDKYFPPFFELQQTALAIVRKKHPRCSFLEDYLTIFPDLDASFSRDGFRDRLQPLVTIARNNGFEFLE